jgi:drug/metabolite transporter (DMT)-like permease
MPPPVSTAAVYGLVLIVGVGGAVGDVFLYHWAKGRGWPWLLASYAAWLATITILGYMLRMERFPFSTAIVLTMVIHTAVAVACDLLFFGQRLSRLEWAGIVLALAAVALLEFGRDPNHQPPAAQR